MAQIDFNHDGVGHFISDNYVKVPVFQRPYSWDRENVLDFFHDLGDAYPNEYFIGTIVLTEKEQHLEIIDGQQRIATTIIFYSALRDFMKELKDDAAVHQYESDYLFRMDLTSRDTVLKITLGDEDNNFFKNNIVENQSVKIPISKESHKRIDEAYKAAYTFIKEQYTGNGKSKEYLFALAEYIKNKVQLIIVTVDDETNAFTVFETLNDRGLTLSQTDLIKNYLFNKSGKTRLTEVQHKWTAFKSAIETSENEAEILEYIRISSFPEVSSFNKKCRKQFPSGESFK